MTRQYSARDIHLDVLLRNQDSDQGRRWVAVSSTILAVDPKKTLMGVTRVKGLPAPYTACQFPCRARDIRRKRDDPGVYALTMGGVIDVEYDDDRVQRDRTRQVKA